MGKIRFRQMLASHLCDCCIHRYVPLLAKLEIEVQLVTRHGAHPHMDPVRLLRGSNQTPSLPSAMNPITYPNGLSRSLAGTHAKTHAPSSALDASPCPYAATRPVDETSGPPYMEFPRRTNAAHGSVRCLASCCQKFRRAELAKSVSITTELAN